MSKNKIDRQRELRILTISMRGPYDKSQSTAQVRRSCRQLQRAWAVSNRNAFGKKSIAAYLDYLHTFSNLTGDHS